MATIQRDLAAAVSTTVTAGSTVYLGNFGTQLFAVGHELIRQELHDLHVVVGSGGILLDQLIGAGVVSEATFAHCWSPVGPTPTWNFRRMAEEPGTVTVRLHDVSLGMFNAALQAGALGIPFMPMHVESATGYVADDWTQGLLAQVEFDGQQHVVIRAIVPDVAFVHVDVADEDGNAMIHGPLGESTLAARAARTLVVVTERIADREELRRLGPTLPSLLVDHVVQVEGSARPDGTRHTYRRDNHAYADYSQTSRTPDGFAAWLDDVRVTDEPDTSPGSRGRGSGPSRPSISR